MHTYDGRLSTLEHELDKAHEAVINELVASEVFIRRASHDLNVVPTPTRLEDVRPAFERHQDLYERALNTYTLLLNMVVESRVTELLK